MTSLTDAFRLVLRASPSRTVEPDANMPSGNAPITEPAASPAEPPAVQPSSGTPVAIAHRPHSGALRRTKPAGALRPGDAIRLATGERVVITYTSAGFSSTDRYLEWRGPLTSNWANVPLDAQVILAHGSK